MKKEELVLQIENLIEEIIENAVVHFTINLEDGVIEDWKNGYFNDKCKQNNKYISYRSFTSLYANFKFDLEQANIKTLNYIINYLNKEIKYDEFRDLDIDLYTIDEFEDLATNE